MPRGIAVAIRILSVVLYIGLAAHAHAQSSFYQGKTIKLVLGAEPGGSGDTRSRVVASFLRCCVNLAPMNPPRFRNSENVGGKLSVARIGSGLSLYSNYGERRSGNLRLFLFQLGILAENILLVERQPPR
jgi:hypothetical protein